MGSLYAGLTALSRLLATELLGFRTFLPSCGINPRAMFMIGPFIRRARKHARIPAIKDCVYRHMHQSFVNQRKGGCLTALPLENM